MKTYSDFVDRVFLQEKLLEKLIPGDPQDYALVRKIQTAEDKLITGDQPIKNAEMFALRRGGLLYAADAIHEAHTIFQDAKGDLGSYWHGMMHRREGDFDNARYWFRRAGVAPVPVMQLDSVESIKLLVAGGLGASIVPRSSLNVRPPGTMARRLRPGLTRHLALVARREKIIDRGLRVLIEALRGIARG